MEVRLTDDEAAVDAFHGLVSDEAQLLPFDISLYVKGTDTKTQPKDGYKVKLTLPLPEALWTQRDRAWVAHLSNGQYKGFRPS